MFDEAISLLSIWASLSSWLTPTVLFLLLNLMIGTIAITSGFTSYKPHHQNHHDTALHHHHHHHQPPQPQLTRAPSLLQRLKSVNFYSYYSHNPPTTLVHQQAPPHATLQQNPLPATDPLPHPKLDHGLPKVPVRLSFRTQIRTPLFDETVISQSRAYAQAQAQAQAQTCTPSFDEEIITHSRVQTPVFPEEIVTQTRTPLEEDIIDVEGPTLEEIYNRIKGSSSSVHYNRQNSDTKPVGGEIPVKLPAKIKKSASDKSAFNHFEAAENVPPPPAVEEYVDVVAEEAGTGGCEVDARADDFISRFKKQLQLQKMESIVRYKEMITRGSGK